MSSRNEARIAALAERSSYVENVLSHAFVAEVASTLWQRDPPAILQIFNSEVDDAGFDLVFRLGAMVRYIQLKQAHENKVPPSCTVRASFGLVPGSCVVLLTHTMDDLRLKHFRFYGASPDTPMPDISTRPTPNAPGRRTKDGVKKVRSNYRKVLVSSFEGPMNALSLVEKLFPSDRVA